MKAFYPISHEKIGDPVTVITNSRDASASKNGQIVMAQWQIMKMLPDRGGDLCERQKNEERSITGKQTNQQEKTNKQRNERSITDK